MRNGKRWAAALLSTLLTGFACTVPAWAALSEPDRCMVYDDADVLTDAEEEALNERILETAESIDMNVAVLCSGTHISESYTRGEVESVYFDMFGEESDGLIYYMDLSGGGDVSYSPYDYIYTRGMAQFYYTNSDSHNRIDEIFEALDPYLPRGEEQPYDAVMQFCDELEYYYDKGIPSNYYVYDDEYKQYMYVKDGEIVMSDKRPFHWQLIGLISLVAGMIAATIAFIIIKARYRFKSAPSVTQYAKSNAVYFHQRSDIFLRQYQTRRKIESSSGSGGGGGGGGYSSGGGGGGGHHR